MILESATSNVQMKPVIKRIFFLLASLGDNAGNRLISSMHDALAV